MTHQGTDGRAVWLVAGLLLGLGLSYLWPHQPATAFSVDRNDKFAMMTAPVGELNDAPDAVFVLDFLTGRLSGAILDKQTGTRFDKFYFRSVAADFQVDPNSKTSYTLTSGYMPFQARGRAQWAKRAIYVGEMTSGKAAAYKFPYSLNPRPQPPVALTPVAVFPFRGVSKAE